MWVLYIVDIAKKDIVYMDPMSASTTVSSAVFNDLESIIQRWQQATYHTGITTWKKSSFRSHCQSYELISQSCDCGIAVLSCIQCIEQDMIPVYHLSDIIFFRKKIYYYLINDGFPIV